MFLQRCMMNCWCLNTMLYDELLMNMKLWCEVVVVVVTTIVVNVFKVVSVVQDDEVIRCCLSCWVHAYSFCWGFDALWAFALYVEGLMSCELLLFMLRVWCYVSVFMLLCWGFDALDGTTCMIKKLRSHSRVKSLLLSCYPWVVKLSSIHELLMKFFMKNYCYDELMMSMLLTVIDELYA